MEDLQTIVRMIKRFKLTPSNRRVRSKFRVTDRGMLDTMMLIFVRPVGFTALVLNIGNVTSIFVETCLVTL